MSDQLSSLFSNPPTEKPSPQNLQLLSLMAQMGMSSDILTMLLEFAGGKLSLEQKRYLQGPIVQHKSPWAETTPQWMYQQIPAERFAIVLEEVQNGQAGWQVGPTELSVAIYPASMDAPMREAYAQIYLWASAQASAQHYQKHLAQIWEQIGRPVEDHEVLQSGGRYYHTYRELCQDLRRKIIKVQAQREKKAPTTPKKATAKPSDGLSVEQLRLF
ncbi:MAG: hypothetical protein AAFN10_22910 [Bacteroidota bacterium]